MSCFRAITKKENQHVELEYVVKDALKGIFHGNSQGSSLKVILSRLASQGIIVSRYTYLRPDTPRHVSNCFCLIPRLPLIKKTKIHIHAKRTSTASKIFQSTVANNFFPTVPPQQVQKRQNALKAACHKSVKPKLVLFDVNLMFLGNIRYAIISTFFGHFTVS